VNACFGDGFVSIILPRFHMNIGNAPTVSGNNTTCKGVLSFGRAQVVNRKSNGLWQNKRVRLVEQTEGGRCFQQSANRSAMQSRQGSVADQMIGILHFPNQFRILQGNLEPNVLGVRQQFDQRLPLTTGAGIFYGFNHRRHVARCSESRRS
jgi:hypothetical protein